MKKFENFCKALNHLQTIRDAEEFEASLDEAQRWALSVRYHENDVNDIIKSTRKKKRIGEL